MSPPPKYPSRAWTYCTELFKGYPAVSVLVCIDYGLVHDLLELCILQVVAYHHLQHLEEFAVGDVAVLIHVIDPESNCGATLGRGRQKYQSVNKFTVKDLGKIIFYINLEVQIRWITRDSVFQPLNSKHADDLGLQDLESEVLHVEFQLKKKNFTYIEASVPCLP